MAWYAKFDGVDGSSTQKGHDKWAVVHAVSLSGHKAGGGATGSTRVGGKLHISDMSLTILADKVIPKLFEATAKGKVFPKVEIEGTATYGNAGQQTYQKFELKNAQITSLNMGAGDADAGPQSADLSLNFEEIKQTYTEYGKDGAKGGNVEFEWKVEEGE